MNLFENLVRALIVSVALWASTTTSAHANDLKGEAVEEIIHEVFIDQPLVAEAVIVISNCESTGLVHRRSDGSYLPNTTGSGAAGALQLTVSTHQQESDRLGLELNLSTDAGYFSYVRYLVEKRGFRDWRWSEHCWGDEVDHIMRGNDPRRLLS